MVPVALRWYVTGDVSIESKAEKLRRVLAQLTASAQTGSRDGGHDEDTGASTVLAALRARAALKLAAQHGRVPSYDGHHPQLGTVVRNAALPVSPPFTNRAGQRSVAAYTAVINQFAVAENPRYRPDGPDGDTYCNTFVWDVSRAMEAEVPHWVSETGAPAEPRCGVELNANDTVRWLATHGPDYGWTIVSAEDAQRSANEGRPVIFAWFNRDGRGHVGVVRPGVFHSTLGPAVAQAGRTNDNDTPVGRIFDSYDIPTYYAHE